MLKILVNHYKNQYLDCFILKKTGDKVNINLKMGNCKVKSPSPSSPESPRVRYIKPLPEEHMQGLMDNTNMSRNEIKMWYEGFMVSLNYI